MNMELVQSLEIWMSAGIKLVQQLKSDGVSSCDFWKTGVTDYQSLLALFQFAFDKYGHIDLACRSPG